MDTATGMRDRLCKFALMVIILAVIIGPRSLSTHGIDVNTPAPPSDTFVNVRDKGAAGDGVTNDSAAIILAFNEAQAYGKDLYFPAGTYNFNNANLWAYKNLRIFGDGESTVLYMPGYIRCFYDISVEDLSVYKETGVFVYMQPVEYSDLYVNNVKVYNDLEAAEDCKPFYACLNEADLNRGINNVTFTNNNISNCQAGLILQCEVKSGGVVDGNVITNIGSPNVARTLYGISLGVMDANSHGKIKANNLTVSNNTITNMYSPVGSVSSSYGIIVIGTNVKILNNRLENLEGYTGIYSKATDLTISGNTVVNGGRLNGICVKNWSSEDNDILIENNKVSSLLTDRTISNSDKAVGIRIEAPRFRIRNNEISVYTQYTDTFIDSTAITTASAPIEYGVIDGNNIYSERTNAILINSGMDGYLAVNNNTITQHIKTESTTGGKLIYLKLVSDSSVVDCKNNEIDIDRGAYLIYGSSLSQGSILNLSENTITTKSNSAWMLQLAGMACNMTDNTITLNDNPEFYSAGTQTAGLLSGGASPVPYRVENNTINCNALNTSYLFSMPTSFTMTGNQIRFAPDSKLYAVVAYNPEADASAGDVTTITKNTVGDIAGAISGGIMANADYFVRFYTAKGYAFPEIHIEDNLTVIMQRLISKPTTGTGISNAGLVSITGNLIYSELSNNVSAVIDLKIAEPNLRLGNNWRASSYEDITNG